MARAFPLQALLDHAQHRLEAAERLLRMLKRKEEAAQTRLQELTGYRQEYRTQLTGQGQGGISIHMLRDYQVFMLKLEQAVGQQEREVELAAGRWRQAEDNWLELRRRVKAYEALAQRHAHAETARTEKLEQRQTDELGLQRSLAEVGFGQKR